MATSNGETSTVRVSLRTTESSYKKLVRIAKAKGWINAQGQPNISRVINFLVEEFDANVLKRVREKR